jgi:predicted Zn-dependent peptidase
MSTELKQRLVDPVALPALSAAAHMVHGGVERLSRVPEQLAAVSPADVRATAQRLAKEPYRLLTRGPRP